MIFVDNCYFLKFVLFNIVYNYDIYKIKLGKLLYNKKIQLFLNNYIFERIKILHNSNM